MEDRYLGSDTNTKRLVDASTQAVGVQAQVSQANQRASSSVVDTMLQGQSQLQQLEMQRLQAEVQRASQPTGLQGLVRTAGEIYGQEQKRKAEQAQQQAKQQQAEQELEREQAFTMANEAVFEVEREAVNNNWNEGTTNFKSRVAKTLAAYPQLTPAQINKILTRVNEVATARDRETFKSREETTERQGNLQADSEIQKFLNVTMVTPVAQLKRLMPTEQSGEYIDKYITPRFQEFLKRNPQLTLEQKLRAEKLMLEQIGSAMSEKSEGYASYVAKTKALAAWTAGNNEITQGLYAGTMTSAEAKARRAALEFETGYNFADYMGNLGEDEERRIKTLQQIDTIAKLEESAKQRAIANFSFSAQTINTLAARAMLDPAILTQLEGNAAYRNSDLIKNVQNVIARVREAREAYLQQGVADAKTLTQLQELNLTDVNNFVSLSRTLATKVQGGQAQTPKDVLLMQTLTKLAEGDPVMAESLRQIATPQGLSPQQLAELQQTLAVQRQAIEQVKLQVVNENKAARQAIDGKYFDVLRTWGEAIVDPSRLQAIADAGDATMVSELQNFQTRIQEASQSVIQTPTYGRQPNFNSAGGVFAGSVQRTETGETRYTIAPKTALQVQKHSAGDFITPIQAGVRALHSFNMGSKGGALGGGYGAWRNRRGTWSKSHAGIDFPLNGGQKAVSVVSGKVLSVRQLSGYGGTIDVLGDNGFVYRYAHQAPYVKAGQRVQAGDAISTSNGSGAGAHHLHFEVRPYAEYQKNQFGMGGTVDPIAHLRELTMKAGTSHGSSRTDLRGQPTQAVESAVPWLKVSNNSIFSVGGGVMNGNIFQQVGKPSQPTSKVFNAQRPMTNTTGLQSFRAGQPQYDYNNNFGYQYLSRNEELRKAFVDAAKELRVPATWLVDIAAQESGTFRFQTRVHNPNSRNQNYGLFGFGKDSGVKNYLSLNPVQQVKAYVKYMKDNGWMKHLERVGGNADIAQLWAMTRMGYVWRQDLLNGRKNVNMRLDDSGLTFADELRKLGRDVGREYDIPGGARSGRSRRNSAVRTNIHSNLQQSLNVAGVDEIFSREA